MLAGNQFDFAHVLIPGSPSTCGKYIQLFCRTYIISGYELPVEVVVFTLVKTPYICSITNLINLIGCEDMLKFRISNRINSSILVFVSICWIKTRQYSCDCSVVRHRCLHSSNVVYNGCEAHSSLLSSCHAGCYFCDDEAETWSPATHLLECTASTALCIHGWILDRFSVLM